MINNMIYISCENFVKNKVNIQWVHWNHEQNECTDTSDPKHDIRKNTNIQSLTITLNWVDRLKFKEKSELWNICPGNLGCSSNTNFGHRK